MIKNITPAEAHSMLHAGDAVLIDVREADEFAAGHIPYARSMPLSKLDRDIGHLNLHTPQQVIFQCQKGMRSHKACAFIQAQDGGEVDIYNLDGGLDAWVDAGLPLISPHQQTTSGKGCCGAKPQISIFRQVQIIMGGLISLLILIGFFVSAAAFIFAGIFAGALMVAGITGWCGLAMLLDKLPWNKKN